MRIETARKLLIGFAAFLVMGILAVGALAILKFKNPSSGLRTAEHDGHLWILKNQAAPFHHPECPCHRKDVITPAEIEGRKK